MDLYDYIEASVWKQLTDEQKKEVFGPLLMYFVSPLQQIKNTQLKTFEMCGMKYRTFELEIENEPFVFVPAQKEVILGWDQGTNGLKIQELLGNDYVNFADHSTFSTALSKEDLANIKDQIVPNSSYDLQSAEGISEYINDFTTPLRKVSLPAMLVSKRALPFGTEYKGIYDCVSGHFQGEKEFFDYFERKIYKQFHPILTLEESLAWSYPHSILEENKYFIEQVGQTNQFAVYKHLNFNFHEQQQAIRKFAYDFLTEDQWEYIVGGGTRRLFRWGNEVDIDNERDPHNGYQKARASNMFGIEVDTRRSKYEITDNPFHVKLDLVPTDEDHRIKQLLPLASYYRSKQQVNVEEKLTPKIYTYRKAIVIEP